MKNEITYKKPQNARNWLEAALKKEWEKYGAIPVNPDLMPGHELAQAWGYVVAGYFLIEQSIKTILNDRNFKPPKTHTLSVLYAELPLHDQEALQAYYDDFRYTFPGMNSFPFSTLEKFLVNLDGGKNSRGHFIGSFDWRYFPTQSENGSSMPLVSINAMHEIVYGCLQVARSIERADGKSRNATYSCRLRWQRLELQQDWLTVRMNAPNWGQDGDRLEILWGPTYKNRYDYLVFKGTKIRAFFAPLPSEKEVALLVCDKRQELASFDPSEGFRIIGVRAISRLSPKKQPSTHVMF